MHRVLESACKGRIAMRVEVRGYTGNLIYLIRTRMNRKGISVYDLKLGVEFGGIISLYSVLEDEITVVEQGG